MRIYCRLELLMEGGGVVGELYLFPRPFSLQIGCNLFLNFLLEQFLADVLTLYVDFFEVGSVAGEILLT